MCHNMAVMKMWKKKRIQTCLTLGIRLEIFFDIVSCKEPRNILVSSLVDSCHMVSALATSQLIQQMCFHLPVCLISVFCTSQKPPQVQIKTVLRIRFFFLPILAIPSLFFKLDTPKCVRKNGVGNPATVCWVYLCVCWLCKTFFYLLVCTPS